MGRGRRGRRKISGSSRLRPKTRQTDDQTPEWVIDINTCLKEGLGYDSGRSWTIYRVPRNLCEVHKSSFIPKIISIGPFHYGDQSLQVMEEHKMRYLLRLLGFALDPLLQHVQGETRLESLARAMAVLEKKTRECYSEPFDIGSDDFVQMMVVDGCFIIELLRFYHKYEEEDMTVDDPIFTTRWMLRTLQRDLLMLENQIPFFVLEELFKLTSIDKEPSLVELTLRFFDPLLPRPKKMLQIDSEAEIDHMLDLFRSSFLSSVMHYKPISNWRDPKETASRPLVEERQLIHSAWELQEAGVKFIRKEDSDLLDIEFENGLFKIPTLYIDDNTVPLFLNFVAYEQCDEGEQSYFTSYFMVFDSLVDSTSDVRILHKNGIINHVLGSDKDVAYLFNRLAREIVYDVDGCHMAKQMKGVNDYYRAYYATKWHVWLTNLIRDYFSSPWTFLSLLAAIILLLLTVTQTVFSCLSYFLPPSTS
ncbi:hypothetical protein FRX31_031229 [Thalictrum thalictroides]|uniref:Uncharacterized protein n=1 Tax=Thalictrum thalictroides TaxID=46969 RepID=A0A7J6V2R2_THATH|nr:hypothetical protein FRX31_031229 [Thalictrum thalictroides]